MLIPASNKLVNLFQDFNTYNSIVSDKILNKSVTGFNKSDNSLNRSIKNCNVLLTPSK